MKISKRILTFVLVVTLMSSAFLLPGCQSSTENKSADVESKDVTDKKTPEPEVAKFTGPSYFVDTKWLSDRLEDTDIRIVDVRTKDLYDQGHIKGAVNLPIADTTDKNNPVNGMIADQQTIETKLGDLGISNDNKVIIYDEGSFFAGRGAWVMLYYGHDDVAILDGGLKKWQQDSLEVTTEAPQITKAVFKATPNPDINVTTEQVKGWIAAKDDSVMFVDTRPYKEWIGLTGHLPDAERMDWVEILSSVDPPLIMTAVDMQKVLDKHGITKDKDIVLY